MKWNLKPVSVMKQFAVSMSMATMCLSPLAQGAAAVKQKNLINQYLKETGLTTKKMTVLEFWRMVRHVYPENMRNDLDTWVAANRNQMMPEFSATSFTDKNGIEQVRVNLSRDGENVSLTFTGDEDVPVKFNAVPITKKELLNYNNFNGLLRKLAKEDKTFSNSLKKTGTTGATESVLTIQELKQRTLRQQVEYLYQLRLTVEAAQAVFKDKYGDRAELDHPTYENKYDFVLKTLFGDCAFAVQIPSRNDLCIVAGNISKYGKNLSCGSEDKAIRGSCQTGSVACNSLVYGVNSDGSQYCVPPSNVRYATAFCNEKSPLRSGNYADKKKLIESYMRYVQGRKDFAMPDESKLVDGKISPEKFAEIEQYLESFKKYVADATESCESGAIRPVADVRKDQRSACEELKKRQLELDKIANVDCTKGPIGSTSEGGQCVCPNKNTPGTDKDGKQSCEVAPVPPPVREDCSKIAGSKADDSGVCKCENNQPPEEKNGKRVCVASSAQGGDEAVTPRPEPQSGRPEPAEDDKGPGWWARNKSWIGPVAGGLALIGLIALMIKASSKSYQKPVYVPPAPVPNPTTNPTVTPTPVLPPPVAPCSGTWVNGVCVPPVVVAPPANNSGGEGGIKTGTQPAGGTR